MGNRTLVKRPPFDGSSIKADPERSVVADETKKKVEVLTQLVIVGASLGEATAPPGADVRYPIRGNLRRNDLIAHVEKETTLAVALVRREACRSICIDFDTLDRDILQRAFGTLRELCISDEEGRTRSLPFLVNSSGRKGYHIWILLHDTDAATAVELGRGLDRILEGHDQIKPNSTSRRSNLMKLPLGIHPITKNETPFLDPSDLDKALRVEDIDVDSLKVTAEQMRDALHAYFEDRRIPLTATSHLNRNAIVFKSGFPCVQSYFDKGLDGPPEEGRRHRATLMIASQILRQCGRDKQTALRMGIDWVERLDPNSYESSLERARAKMIEQIERAYKPGNEPYKIGCKESLFADLLRRRCDKCACTLNHSNSRSKLILDEAILFCSRMAGPTTGFVYIAHVKIRNRFREKYKGTVLEGCYYADFEQIADLVGKTRQTASKHTQRLITNGFIEQLPSGSIPKEFRNPTGRDAHWYRIVELDEDLRGKLQSEFTPPWQEEA